jgi:NAD(P)-dependent dehydrogenase (short-subunit alcohol dehydrogenase family)
LNNYLVFGSSGTLGKEIVSTLKRQGSSVVEAARAPDKKEKIDLKSPDWLSDAATLGPFDGVVWAQGANSSDTILTADKSTTLSLMESNVMFIVETIQKLVSIKALNDPCRTVVLSSIWQESSRSSKFSYSVSKSALHGLVQSAAIDLASEGISINAVMPGIIDTPMTRANLTADEIKNAESRSLGGQLATAENVAETVSWLLGKNSRGINGEFIKVDHGWSINSGL